MFASLRPFFGAALVAMSALVLGVLLWQISRLNNGLNQASVDRYRFATRTASALVATWEALSAYRRALVLGDTPARTLALRDDIDTRMRALAVIFRKGGAAATYDRTHDWAATQMAWRAVRDAPGGPRALPLFVNVSRYLDNLIYDLSNNSGLNYDNPNVQNISQIVFNLAPEGYDRVERSVIAAIVAVRSGGMSLQQRLSFSAGVGTIEGDYDLSQNDVPGFTRVLSRLMPNRTAEFERIAPLARRYESSGKAIYALLYQQVLFKNRPAIDPKTIDATAGPALLASRQLRALLSSHLDAMTVARGQKYRTRQLLIGFAYFAGSLLLASLILLTAQIVWWRNREALRLAREESRRLAAELAHQRTAEALRISEARGRELETIASFDALTGVMNRRAFDRALSLAWETSQAHGYVLGLLMIDIDHFKLFNDRYGHQSGDQCLQAVANACADAVRGEDVFARYGGEEFAAIVPKATREDLESIADRMRGAVCGLNIPHVTDTGRVTLSIGAAAIVASGAQSVAELVARADASLYRAKDGGRDRLFLSDEIAS